MKYYAVALIFVAALAVAVGIQFAAGFGSHGSFRTQTVTQMDQRDSSQPLVSTSTAIARSSISSDLLSSPVTTSLQFNQGSALNYFLSLNTSTKLLTDYHGDSVIYLSDDQALDYNALMDIHASTQNASALQLANQINDTMIEDYGSLYHFWNGVFVLFGNYPSASQWNVTGGSNKAITTDGSYRILSTIFPQNNNTRVELEQYVDLALYYAIWNAKVANISGSGGNLTAAAGIFGGLQSDCANYGCLDAANVGQASSFQSYKVALDLIAYKVLSLAGAFQGVREQQMAYVNQTISKLVFVANHLQASNGGVYTQYNMAGASVAPVGVGVDSAENGETTSLFVLADYLWNNPAI